MSVSKVEVVVLGCLAEEPMYGYELLERMRQRGMASWSEVGKASVYQALQRVERRGWVSGRDQEGPDGPDRRVYRITRAGRSRLTEGLSARFGDRSPYETEAGLALGFVHLLSAADARKAVDARERAVLDLLADVKAERSRTTGDRGSSRTVSDGMLDRQASLAKAELAWIKTFRTTLGRIRR